MSIPNEEQQLIERSLAIFGIDCQPTPDSSTLRQEALTQLAASFENAKKEQEALQRELYFLQEAKRLEIPLEEYQRLYKAYSQQQSLINRIWNQLSLNAFWQWFGGDKKPWDLIQLLATISIPILLTIGTTYLSVDRARQETLNKYFDFITDLLSKEIQSKSKVNDANMKNQLNQDKVILELDEGEINDTTEEERLWIVARARTLNALRELDESRKVQLLVFLKESKLIQRKNPKILLRDADLTNLDLRDRDLSSLNLNFANLQGTLLQSTNLSDSDLSNADMTRSILINTDLRGSNLSRAKLTSSDLEQTKLCQTILPETIEGEGENNRDCPKGGYVNTAKNFGLNIRSGPGLKYPVIGGAVNGAFLPAGDRVIYSDGYTWVKLPTGGWYQADYVDSVK